MPISTTTSSSPASTSLRDAFLLEPGYHYLNHGSFGACPKPVFAAYQDWQLRLERHPGQYMADIAGLLAESRAALAAYLNVPPGDVVYFTNPTTALNMAIRSLAGDTHSRYRLWPGDEILTTDHEYGSLDKTWQYVCRLTGARYVAQHIPLPVTTQAEFVERFLAGVTPARKRYLPQPPDQPHRSDLPRRRDLPARPPGRSADHPGRRARAGADPP